MLFRSSLAIGREGQNVRLAARLTEWKIDIEGAGEIAPKIEAEETESPTEAVEEAPAAAEAVATEKEEKE